MARSNKKATDQVAPAQETAAEPQSDPESSSSHSTTEEASSQVGADYANEPSPSPPPKRSRALQDSERTADSDLQETMQGLPRQMLLYPADPGEAVDNHVLDPAQPPPVPPGRTSTRQQMPFLSSVQGVAQTPNARRSPPPASPSDHSVHSPSDEPSPPGQAAPDPQVLELPRPPIGPAPYMEWLMPSELPSTVERPPPDGLALDMFRQGWAAAGFSKKASLHVRWCASPEVLGAVKQALLELGVAMGDNGPLDIPDDMDVADPRFLARHRWDQLAATWSTSQRAKNLYPE